ncbi:hypothetical protein IC582_008399 [Cucumis melo]
MDPSKVKATVKWLSPTNVAEVHSFHGLATFYRRSICKFSSIVFSLTNCLKNDRFKWNTEEEDSFCLLKSKIVSASILVLPNFEKVFKVEIDACLIDIGAVWYKKANRLNFSGRN